MSDKRILVVMDDGGVSYVDGIPEGYTVEIRDYDVPDDIEPDGVDEEGDAYQSMEFTSKDNSEEYSLTPAIREAVWLEMGYGVRDDAIQEAEELLEDFDDKTLASLLFEKEMGFKASGGRGVELADEIDQLRIVLAVRKVRKKD
jgi:hypothetical protein